MEKFNLEYLKNSLDSAEKDLKTHLDINNAISFGFINERDYSPRKCKYCGCKEFEEHVTDSIDQCYIVLEKESYCKQCNKTNGYWVTGHWIVDSIETKAKQYAIEKHKNQLYGMHEYSYHLEQVIKIASEYIYLFDKYDDNDTLKSLIYNACWLHDVIEDTDTNYDDLVKEFGLEIANVVSLLSTNGKNRKERYNEAFYYKLKENKYALFIKICDRIANVNNCIETKNKKLLSMYRNEYRSFRFYLYNKEFHDMFIDLDLMFEKF